MSDNVESSAATVLREISRSHLECTICHERYQTPKLLECLHSFCENCLITYTRSLKVSSVLECPVCRRETRLGSEGVGDLKTNFHLMGMVEDFSIQEKLTQRKGLQLICELCTHQQEAQSRCMDCPFFLCGSCQEAHRRIAATANHDVVTLDTLRSGVVSVRGKGKDDPPCEKHRGEKKRFFCETCKVLICRDCTVVEHRESEHKFTTIEDSALRRRQTTKDLMARFEESLSTHKEAEHKLTEMYVELDKSSSLALHEVIEQAAEEGRKIAERAANVHKDLSCREKLRLKLTRKIGSKLTKRRNVESESTGASATVGENQQKYSETVEEKFKAIDNTLTSLNQIVEKFLLSDQEFHTLMKDLKEEARKDATDDDSKVKANEKQLLSQIRSVFYQRQKMIKEVIKITSAQIMRMRHTLDIASDMVKSASNNDLLNLHSVIDDDLRVLLEESPPKLPPGYPKIEFKSSGDTNVGEMILGATWKWTRNIDFYNYYYDSIRSISAFTNNEIVVSPTESGSYTRVFDTTGQSRRNFSARDGRMATLPDNSIVSVTSNMIYLCAPNSSSWTQSSPLTSTAKRNGSNVSLGNPTGVAHYKDEKIIVSYCIDTWQGILVVNSSNGVVIRQLPLSIRPDFLTCTSRGRMLVAERSLGRVEGLDSRGSAVFAVYPTVAGAPEGKQLTCVGICCDSLDIIYVAMILDGDTKVHVHQYSPHGNFIGCFTATINPPVSGIAVTGDGKLVLAEQWQLRLFEMT